MNRLRRYFVERRATRALRNQTVVEPVYVKVIRPVVDLTPVQILSRVEAKCNRLPDVARLNALADRLLGVTV